MVRLRRFHIQALEGTILAGLVAMCLLPGPLSLPSVSAKRTTTLVRMERLGNCPEYPNLPCGFSESGVFPMGKTQWGRGIMVFGRNYTRFTKVVARILRCTDRNDPHCELFQTWRFGDESCSFLTMKGMLWTPLFRMIPTQSCPIRAGAFKMENVTVDLERLKAINFPDKGYWKVNVEVEADKIPKQLCYYFEATFIKVRE
ncbi:uncharacterized protein LOC113210090 [Frankliniella occidentalis]|uniref:Uncharacterized protein LOC113210090 n=1 Tax=Frankliniella occidentalis TaxID=133901 RepID=A0A6J1SWH8_FRAOC|nr:uncharacterized protein LOC113210090 [Frankliniella occidentalis]